MQLLQLRRGQGKSTRALTWLVAGEWLSGRGRGPWSRILVTATEQRAEDLRNHLYNRLGRPTPDQPPTAVQAEDWQRVDPLVGPGYLYEKFWAMSSHIVTPHALLQHGRDQRIEVAVDGLDDVLFALFHHNVALATLTPEETR